MKNIRDEIVAHRQVRVATEGYTLGCKVPEKRAHPVLPFPGDPAVICEVKRRSPSRGAIDANLDPAEHAGRYIARGARAISVLTEEDYFHGSLRDLMAVKNAHPGCAVLRKDFLTNEEDIAVTARAGADAVLLIASILSPERLGAMLNACRRHDLTPLVEVHDAADVEKVRPFSPGLLGINSRNLSTFAVDLLAPLAVHELVDWNHRVIFESGVFSREDARVVARSGFNGILVGEAVVKDPGRVTGISEGLRDPDCGVAATHPTGDFWLRLMRRQMRYAGIRRPLVKICGITNREDALLAARLGADILGFILADSPRRTRPELLSELADLPVLKAAVVVSGGRHGSLSEEAGDLLRNGLVDVIQFHGDETPEQCAEWAFPYYKALRPGSREEIDGNGAYGCPRRLIDASSTGAYGGTGQRVAEDLAEAARETGPLWLAGGLNPENIASAVRRFEPELVDASSGLESSPGKKDHERLRRFFRELDHG